MRSIYNDFGACMNEKQKEILDKMEPGVWYTAYDLYTNIKTMLVLLREEKVRMDREYKPGMSAHKNHFTKVMGDK